MEESENDKARTEIRINLCLKTFDLDILMLRRKRNARPQKFADSTPKTSAVDEIGRENELIT